MLRRLLFSFGAAALLALGSAAPAMAHLRLSISILCCGLGGTAGPAGYTATVNVFDLKDTPSSGNMYALVGGVTLIDKNGNTVPISLAQPAFSAATGSAGTGTFPGLVFTYSGPLAAPFDPFSAKVVPTAATSFPSGYTPYPVTFVEDGLLHEPEPPGLLLEDTVHNFIYDSVPDVVNGLTETGTLALNSNMVTNLASTAGILPGQVVYGPGLTAPATVVSVTPPSTVKISVNAVPNGFAGTTVPVTFVTATANTADNAAIVTPPGSGCVGCSSPFNNASNFNGTPIAIGNWIWFNANFSVSGVPAGGATVYFTNQTITLTDSNGIGYNLTVPASTVKFQPAAACAATESFGPNGWAITVPNGGADEILLAGFAWKVPAGFSGKVISSVNWTGRFGSNVFAVNGSMKWGANVYSQMPIDGTGAPIYVAAAGSTAGINPAILHGCSGGDHAGTPEGDENGGQAVKQFLVGGARGGGGSNFTGSWSGTIHIGCNGMCAFTPERPRARR